MAGEHDEGMSEERPAAVPKGRRVTGKVVVGVAVGALLVGGTGLGLALDNAGATTPAPKAVSCSSKTPELTVQGVGQASATPDVLTAVIQFNATAPTAAAALSQDNVKVNGAVLALTTGGVAKKDIQTTGLTLQTQYAYPKGVPTITGYQVTNTVTAILRDMSTAGAAIDAVVGATGNAAQINSLAFSFSNPGAVEDRARAVAVHQAVSHARAMAQAAGRRLGPVCSLTDTTPTQNLQNQDNGFQASAGLSTAAPSVPLESGTQSESDQVTMVYALEAMR
jgi:uncharacterized protein